MMRFRSQADAVATLMMVLALLIFASTLGAFAVTRPLTPLAATAPIRQQEKLTVDTVMVAKKQLAIAQAADSDRMWTGKPEEIGPAVLAKLTTLAKSHRLTLSAFRPQRGADTPEVSMFPFQVSLEGSYPEIVAFTKDLESGEDKLAVTLVQIAATEGASDNASATIGVMAYTPLIAPPKAPTPAKGAKNAHK